MSVRLLARRVPTALSSAGRPTLLPARPHCTISQRPAPFEHHHLFCTTTSTSYNGERWTGRLAITDRHAPAERVDEASFKGHPSVVLKMQGWSVGKRKKIVESQKREARKVDERERKRNRRPL